MIPTIVPFYAAVLGLIFIFLSARVIVARRQFRVRLGSGGNEVLERCIRVQGNFAEYVPITIILLTFLELYGASKWLVHALCIALLLGRCIHAYCVGRIDEDIRQRRAGMALTFGTLFIAAAGVIFYSVQWPFG
jgi:uncharacterized membrane protein YecN with MAPEG domain